MSSKTFRGVGYSKIYPPEKFLTDLYNKAMVDSVAGHRTSNPIVVGSDLLKINDLSQYRSLAALDGATDSGVQIITYDSDIRDSLLLGLDSDFLEVVDTYDSSLSITYAKYHMTRTYGRSYLGVVPNTRVWNVDGNDVIIQDAREVEEEESGIRSIEVDIATANAVSETYVDTLNFEYISTPVLEVQYSYGGTQDTYNDFLVDDNDSYITDENDEYIVLDDVFITDSIRYEYILVDDIITTVVDDQHFLSVVYKSNFVENTARTIKALNNRFGIPNSPTDRSSDCILYTSYGACLEEADPNVSAIQEAIEDSTTKHMMLGYAVEYKEPYIELIDLLLGSNGYRVDLGSGLYMTWYKSNDSKYRDPKTGYALSFVDYSMELNPENGEELTMQYMIPLEWMNANRTLVEKYDDLKESLTLFVYSQKTIKLKWYETGVIGWIIGGIGVLVFLFTGNPTLLLAGVASVIINELELSPILQAVLGVVIGIITSGLSSFTISLKNVFSMVIKLVLSFTQHYFTSAVDSIKERIEEIDEEIEETERLTNEIKRQGIYIPLDTIQNYYDSIYTMQYDLYQSAYDYDKIYFDTSILKNYSLQGPTDG